MLSCIQINSFTLLLYSHANFIDKRAALKYSEQRNGASKTVIYSFSCGRQS